MSRALVLPRRFVLVRDEDVSGISGIGVVAHGVRFADGKTVTRWVASPTHGVAQTCVWDAIEDVTVIHGHGGRTRIEWIDPDPAPPTGPPTEVLTLPAEPPTRPMPVTADPRSWPWPPQPSARP